MKTKIYSYGALPPDPLKPILDQLFEANKYHNALKEIERTRREKSNAALQEKFPTLAALQLQANAANKAVDDAISEVAKANAAARSRVQTKEDRERIAKLYASRRNAFAKLKEAKAEAWSDPAAKDALKAVDSDAWIANKNAYAKCSAYTETKKIVREKIPEMRKGAPPEFKRYTGEGRIAVQIQYGATTKELPNNTYLRLEPGNKNDRMIVKMRIGSNPDRSPIWASIPIIYHRDIPEDAQIKMAWLLRRRQATHDRWFFQFTLTGEDHVFAKETATSGVFGMDVGWRIVPNGLRVAVWIASDGSRGEVVLPHKLLSRWSKSESLQGIRDINFNEIRERMAVWRDENKNTTPEWFKERLKDLRLWHAQRKLAAVVIHWRTNRFPCDEDIFEIANAWRKQDRHLYDWQVNNLARATRCREDMYRCFAATMRKQYAVARIEDTKWNKVQEKPSLENRKDEDALMKKNMRIASVGRLLEIIKDDISVEKIPAKHSTMRCCGCGQLTGEIKTSAILHTCTHCNMTMDQDENAARNLLAGNASGSVAA